MGLLSKLGINEGILSGAYSDRWITASSKASTLVSLSPINNEKVGEVALPTTENYEEVLKVSAETFNRWRLYPAPKRGEVIRCIGEELRKHKEYLGELVTLEVGKIAAEGLGEIQEAIDIADFSVGLSRQLYGKSMHSEREMHRMYEQWHPLGSVGVITAFNFPAAVWAWNAFIAAVCGNTVVWKPSEHAPITAIAMHQCAAKVATAFGFPGLFSLVIGEDPSFGVKMSQDKRLPLISATGSCRMGKSVAKEVADRFGKTILELGGNNALIVMEDADLDLVLRAVLFGAVGTAGQRCTTTRRLIVQQKIMSTLEKRLIKSYSQISVGDPREKGILMGPLINNKSVESFQKAVAEAKKQGGDILFGGGIVANQKSEFYVEPTIIRATRDMKIVAEETFAPILYILSVKDIDEAIIANNEVSQGLSSSIFTKSIAYSERFLSAAGSDCGIANVNIGTSGAEIGGAFGGEKETGGGRESGSDSWKQYMRRQTVTLNYGKDLPLAQGIEFN